MNDLDRLAERIATTSKRFELRQGVVTATGSSPNSVTIKLGGSATSIPGVRYLSSYSPTVSDTVWVIVNDVDLIVIGKLA